MRIQYNDINVNLVRANDETITIHVKHNILMQNYFLRML